MSIDVTAICQFRQESYQSSLSLFAAFSRHILTFSQSTNQASAIMSGHPQGHYDVGYGHQHGTDSYYQDDHAQGYYVQYADYGHGQLGNGGYYDEA